MRLRAMSSNTVTLAVGIVLFIIVIRMYVYMPFKIQGPSMCPLLNLYGDDCVPYDDPRRELTLINRYIYSFHAPQRGDVIVFRLSDGTRYVKRIIGLPKETVRIGDDGMVYVVQAGETLEIQLDEKGYLLEENYGHTYPIRQNKAVFEVPSHSYFVLGDNRLDSADSRHCFIPVKHGCMISKDTPYVERDNIYGRVDYVLWPFTQARRIMPGNYQSTMKR